MQSSDDFIKFYPVGYSLEKYQIVLKKVRFLFIAKDMGFLKDIIFESDKKYECINHKIDNEKNTLTIIVVKDKDLFPKRYDYGLYDENGFVTKDHPMYIKGVNNEIIDCDRIRIYKYHYPNESLHIMNCRDLSFTSIVSKDDDIIRFSKMGMKQLLCRNFIDYNTYSMHGMAVKKGDSAFVFLGGSHKGKSTLFVNLVCNGFAPVNDDIVFFKVIKNDIYVFSLPIKPQIRKGNDMLTMASGYLNNGKILSDPNVFLDVEDDVKLSAIFELSFSENSTTSIMPAFENHTKKILRACISHYPVKPDEKFLDSLNALLNIPYYHMGISSDYNEVLGEFNIFLENMV